MAYKGGVVSGEVRFRSGRTFSFAADESLEIFPTPELIERDHIELLVRRVLRVVAQMQARTPRRRKFHGSGVPVREWGTDRPRIELIVRELVETAELEGRLVQEADIVKTVTENYKPFARSTFRRFIDELLAGGVMTRERKGRYVYYKPGGAKDE